MPKNATIEDIEKIYVLAWEKRLKSITVYRDGCKQGQPVKTSKEQATPKVLSEEVKPVRKRMPAERKAITHKFSIDNQDGYITVGMFDDGTPGEIFITMAKEGSVISGLLDCFATCVSMALQYGVPLPVMINKFSHTRFEPSGFTGNKSIPIAKSIIDYIFRWLAFKFLPIDEMKVVGVNVIDKVNSKSDTIIDTKFDIVSDAPPCHECGMIMVRNGSCYKCANCGSTSGCS
jgi:ribonucleoside-diphosphate reductase alpha chain